VCDLETSRMGAPYIYDISRLKVKDLTLILQTWRKWWAPNNASKEQMGFNSGFKGLITQKSAVLCYFATEARYHACSAIHQKVSGDGLL